MACSALRADQDHPGMRVPLMEADDRCMESPVVPTGRTGTQFFVEEDSGDIIPGTHTGLFGTTSICTFWSVDLPFQGGIG